MVPKFDRTIPPGGRGEIVLAVKTDHYRGRVTKSAMVYTNDPQKKKQQIQLVGKIRQIFKIDPKDIFTIFTKTGEAFDQKIVLTNNLDEPVVITGMKHNLDGFAKVDYKTLEDGQKYEVSLSGQIDKPTRRAGWIRFDLREAPIKTLRLRAFFNVQNPVEKKERKKKENVKQPS
jgi:uncharacterized membrane protein